MGQICRWRLMYRTVVQVRIQGATCASEIHASLLMKQISFSSVYVGFEPFPNQRLGFSKLTES